MYALLGFFGYAIARNLYLFSSFPSSSQDLYFIQCACSSVMSMSNFRTNILEAVQVISSVPIFCDFCQPTVIHYMVSSCSSPDSDPSYDILNLADAVGIFIANSISQSVASDAP